MAQVHRLDILGVIPEFVYTYGWISRLALKGPLLQASVAFSSWPCCGGGHSRLHRIGCCASTADLEIYF